MSEDRTEEGPGAARIDRWLFGVRLFKSRSLATQAVTGGKVHVNGDRVKEIQPVFEGEQVLLLNDGTRVPVTRGFREIQEILKYT